MRSSLCLAAAMVVGLCAGFAAHASDSGGISRSLDIRMPIASDNLASPTLFASKPAAAVHDMIVLSRQPDLSALLPEANLQPSVRALFHVAGASPGLLISLDVSAPGVEPPLIG